MHQVMTTLEARVAQDRVPDLLNAYEEVGSHLDSGVAHTYLAHSVEDPQVWRIVTLWSDGEALEAHRASLGGRARGELIFRAADAEPALEVFEVPAFASNAT